MIEVRATVLRVAGDRAWVSVRERPGGGCGRCDEPGGCRSAKIAYAFSGPKDDFVVPNTAGAQAGEDIVLRIDDGVPLRGALITYGLGVALLLLGAALGQLLAMDGNADLFALAGAVIGVGLAVWINRALLRSRRWRGHFAMEMIRNAPPCASPHGDAA